MIILNTTFVISHTIYDAFVQWLKDVYVPAAMVTGLFSSSRISKILHNEDPRAVNIACELTCDSLSEAVRWHDDTASLLRDDMASHWGENALFFTTYLKRID